MCPKCCSAFPKPWLENAHFQAPEAQRYFWRFPGSGSETVILDLPMLTFIFSWKLARECSLEVPDVHVRHFQAPRSEMLVLKIACNAHLRMLSTSFKPPETCHQASQSSNSIQTKGFPRHSEEVRICLRSPSSKANKLRLMFLCSCMLCF